MLYSEYINTIILLPLLTIPSCLRSYHFVTVIRGHARCCVAHLQTSALPLHSPFHPLHLHLAELSPPSMPSIFNACNAHYLPTHRFSAYVSHSLAHLYFSLFPLRICSFYSIFRIIRLYSHFQVLYTRSNSSTSLCAPLQYLYIFTIQMLSNNVAFEAGFANGKHCAKFGPSAEMPQSNSCLRFTYMTCRGCRWANMAMMYQCTLPSFLKMLMHHCPKPWGVKGYDISTHLGRSPLLYIKPAYNGAVDQSKDLRTETRAYFLLSFLSLALSLPFSFPPVLAFALSATAFSFALRLAACLAARSFSSRAREALLWQEPLGSRFCEFLARYASSGGGTASFFPYFPFRRLPKYCFMMASVAQSFSHRRSSGRTRHYKRLTSRFKLIVSQVDVQFGTPRSSSLQGCKRRLSRLLLCLRVLLKKKMSLHDIPR